MTYETICFRLHTGMQDKTIAGGLYVVPKRDKFRIRVCEPTVTNRN